MKLALLGGKPVCEGTFSKYPDYKYADYNMTFTDEEVEAVVETVKGGYLCTDRGGIKVPEFEEKFADYHQIKEAVAVGSGTAALFIAVAATEIGPGDEVIVPAYTFIATAICALMRNAIPIFVDIDPRTLTIDPEKIEGKVTPRTKAIIPVHLNGHPAHMDEIMAIAKEHNLIVIEDCAQAHGAKYKGRLVGTIGDIGAFSFQQKKNLTTGDGGMLITNNEEFAQKARSFRSFGYSENYSLVTALGGMHRMTELEAAIGIVQLKKLDHSNDIRIENAEYLSGQLKDILGIRIPYLFNEVKHVYYNYSPAFIEEEVGISREKFVQAVQAEGVLIDTGYDEPLYNYPLFRKQSVYEVGCPFTCPFYKIPEDEKKHLYAKEFCPNTEERIYRINLELKIHPPRTREDMKIIVEAFKKVIENVDQLK